MSENLVILQQTTYNVFFGLWSPEDGVGSSEVSDAANTTHFYN